MIATRRTQRRVLPHRLFITDYRNFILGLQPGNMVACWPMWENSGATTVEDIGGGGYDGTPANVTFDVTKFNGRPAPSFNGTNSVIALPVAGLDTPFNGAQLTLLIWFKVAAGIWTDASLDFAVEFGTAASDRFSLNIPAAANTFEWRYQAGGVTEIVTRSGESSTDWNMAAITVDKANDTMRGYWNGVQEGITKTGLGVWAGALDNLWTAIGDLRNTGAVAPWNGNLAYCTVWNAPLSAQKILQAYTSAVV